MRNFLSNLFFLSLLLGCFGTASAIQPPLEQRRLPAIQWRKSLAVGSEFQGRKVFNDYHEDGAMIGTEIRSLVEFDGKIFAGNSYWTDKYFSKTPGPQILVLDKPISEGGQWKEDFRLDQKANFDCPYPDLNRNIGISTLKKITFNTDGKGNKLSKPVDLLVANAWDQCRGLEVFVRDISGKWSKSLALPDAAEFKHIRDFRLYHDKVTGVDMVMAGTNSRPGSPLLVFKGTYNPKLESKIEWFPLAEPLAPNTLRPDPADRVTSFTEANSKLYATVCEKIYVREDGNYPQWRAVYANNAPTPFPLNCPEGPGEWGYRGATTIPWIEGRENFLVGMEGTNPEIRRIDPIKRITERELDIKTFLQNAKEFMRPNVSYVIPAYNDMAKVELPDGTNALFIGIETMIPGVNPVNTWHSWQKGAWFLVRLGYKKYELQLIHDDSDPGHQQRQPMIAPRSFLASPFPSEKGQVIYAAGFDANHVKNENHNTGWIYRGEFVTEQ